MFTFFAVIFSAKWISEHIVHIIVFALFIILVVGLLIRRRNNAIREYKQRAQMEAAEKQRRAEQQRIESEKKAAAEAARVKPFPETIDGHQIEYSYRDVVLIPEGVRRNITRGEELALVFRDDRVMVKANSIPIGFMEENRLAEMVKGWDKKGDPCKCYFMNNTDDGPMVALFFYGDAIGKFLKRNPEAEMVKLTGKPDELAFYDIGSRCEVMLDSENDEQYDVICDNETIGKLPRSAIAYANKHECSPEDLDVIIAEVDYDTEKDRDIISVYISY